MQTEALAGSIIGFLKEEIVDPEVEISPEDSLESLGLESLDLMELVFFLERLCHCKLPPELLKAKNVSTVNSIASFVANFEASSE